MYDTSGNVVAHLIEEEGSLGKAIGRQVLRTRRSFTATVLSPGGDQIIFRLRRPMYLINSTMYVEDGEGQRIGEIQQRWHLWRRRYELFIGTRQFAAVDGGFLAWEFRLQDELGGSLALIDRNFSGFGKELFTDAGRYAIHFGGSVAEAAQQLTTSISSAYPDRAAPPVPSALTRVRAGADVIPTTSGEVLAVSRHLGLEERMIALAAAISIDYDYFSRHSYGGGVLSPFIHPPIIPFPVPAAGSTESEGVPTEAPGYSVEPPSPQQAADSEEGLERNLGGDEFHHSQEDESSNTSSNNAWWGGDDNDGGSDEAGNGGGLSDILNAFGWGDDDE